MNTATSSNSTSSVSTPYTMQLGPNPVAAMILRTPCGGTSSQSSAVVRPHPAKLFLSLREPMSQYYCHIYMYMYVCHVLWWVHVVDVIDIVQ